MHTCTLYYLTQLHMGLFLFFSCLAQTQFCGRFWLKLRSHPGVHSSIALDWLQGSSTLASNEFALRMRGGAAEIPVLLLNLI